MNHRRLSFHFFASALTVALLAIFSGALYADEAQRGLKSTIPVKPQFDEPRFQDNRPDPLQQKQVLPEPSVRPPSDSIRTAPSFFVSKINLLGGTVFSATELDSILSPYENRQVTMEELQSLRQQLSLMYFQRGHVNSGVIIPDQTVENGVVEFRIIEGKVNEVRLSGNEDLNDSYVLDRINLGVDEPLNVNDLQTALKRVKNDRLIRKINAHLRPLSEPGIADLDVSVTEADSRQAAIVVDNFRSPSIGAEAVTIAYTDFNLTGRGDALGVSLSGSEGLRSAGLDYEYPLTASGSKLRGYFNYSDSEVVEEPFRQLDIESESRDFGLAYSTPVYEGDSTNLDVTLGLNHKDSSSFLLGEPFSFSAGAIEGESKSSNISLGSNFVYREATQVTAFSLTWRQGLDLFSSNIADNDNTPDSEYAALVGQGQYALRLPFLPAGQFVARTAFQLAFDPLLSIDKFAVGGRSTVRGYRENQLVRDNGITASVELRFPIFVDDNGNDTANFQVIPFLDWGQAWDEEATGQTDEKLDIASAGLGFAWQPLAGVHVNLFWGEALEDDVKSDDGDDLQDDGLHFSLGYRLTF
jgi:hemolysin activation/secretion protein